MSNKDCYAHLGEVEAVGEADQRKGNNVVKDQFFEVLAWFLEL